MKKRDLLKLSLIIALAIINSIVFKANGAGSDSCSAYFWYYSYQNGTVSFGDSSKVLPSAQYYHWDFGDGDSSTLQNPAHTYSNGIYKATVCLTVANAYGKSCSSCQEVMVRPSYDSCFAKFTYEKDSAVTSHYRIHFIDASTATNSITSRNWTLSDSTHYSGADIWHNFDTTLTYATVRLNIGTSSGCTSSITKTIILKDKCRAGFNAIYQSDTSLTGATYHFENTSSSDATSYQWSFGDGVSSSLKNPTHTYNIQPGSMVNARLQVKTSSNCIDTFVQSITIPRSPYDSCFANFTYEKLDTISALSLVHFADASTAKSNITSRYWTLSDSSHYSSAEFWHNFDTTLTYATVRLNIGTATGCTSSITKTILLKDSVSDKCRAGFNVIYQPDTLTGATYYFKNTSSSDATSYLWAFGDGASSVIKNPIHSYNLQPGSTVNVRLQITTSSSCIDTFAQTITIPGSPSDSCFADFSYLKVDTGGVYRFTDLSSGTHNVVSRFWSLSDSSHYTDSTFTHTFPAGMSTATVCLNITTSSGCQSSICKTIALQPVCVADFSYSAQNDTVRFYNQSQVSLNAVTWHWNFGDSITSTVMNPVHTYASNIKRAYVCLSANTDAGTCTVCKEVIVRSDTDGCVANFIYEPMLTSFLPTYSFTDVSTGNSGIAWRLWSISDSVQYTDSTFTHSFDSTLTRATVCLTIGTNSGCQSSICKTIVLKDTIVPSSCHANFSYSVGSDSLNSTAGKKIYFYDQSYSNSTINYRLWNFGDGSYSQAQNPTHTYNSSVDTTIYVLLFIRTSSGCSDSIYLPANVPGNSSLFSISGNVVGKNELLPQGVIVLYKKADYGLFNIKDVKTVTNGAFKFDQLNAGKYILYAIPHFYYTGKYLPTYYVNKLHWAHADIIDLKSNAYGLDLHLVSVKFLEPGPCKILGSILYTGRTANEQNELKSAAFVSYPVYLYGTSGNVLTSATVDESGAFAFENLPYGKYIVKFEYPNITSDDINVDLTTDSPEKKDLQIVVDESALSVKHISQDVNLTVYNASAGQIAVRVSKGGNYNVSVISSTGRVLMNRQIEFVANTDKTISVGEMPTGIYMVKLQNNTDTMFGKLMR